MFRRRNRGFEKLPVFLLQQREKLDREVLRVGPSPGRHSESWQAGVGGRLRADEGPAGKQSECVVLLLAWLLASSGLTGPEGEGPGQGPPAPKGTAPVLPLFSRTPAGGPQGPTAAL